MHHSLFQGGWTPTDEIVPPGAGLCFASVDIVVTFRTVLVDVPLGAGGSRMHAGQLHGKNPTLAREVRLEAHRHEAGLRFVPN